MACKFCPTTAFRLLTREGLPTLVEWRPTREVLGLDHHGRILRYWSPPDGVRFWVTESRRMSIYEVDVNAGPNEGHPDDPPAGLRSQGSVPWAMSR